MRGHFSQNAAQKWISRLHSRCDFGESGSFENSRPKCLFFCDEAKHRWDCYAFGLVP